MQPAAAVVVRTGPDLPACTAPSCPDSPALQFLTSYPEAPPVRVVYGNISIWGAQVEQFVLCTDADIWIFVEHRMSHPKLCALARRLNRHKLRIHGSVAVHKH